MFADIYAHPEMTMFTETFTTQSAAASRVIKILLINKFNNK